MCDHDGTNALEQQRDDWRNLFLQLLLADGPSRGQAIQNANQPVNTARISGDFTTVARFYSYVEEYGDSIHDGPDRARFLSFFRNSYNECKISATERFDNIEANDRISHALILKQLLHTYWGRRWARGEQFVLEGRIHEYIADAVNPIARSIELEISRAAYQRGNASEEAKRVARKKREVVIESPVFRAPGIKIPQYIAERMASEIDQMLSNWNALAFDEKVIALMSDGFSLCKEEPDYNEIPDSFEDILEGFGGIVTQEIATDGRTSRGAVPSAKAQRLDNVEEFIRSFRLNRLTKPLQEWLLLIGTVEDEAGVQHSVEAIQLIIQAFTEITSLSKNIIDGYEYGLRLFVEEHYRLALAVWIPLFEAALREVLYIKGEMTISAAEVAGLEHFVLLDNLLGRAERYYDIKTVRYWRKWFTKHDGLGINLRNDHCHGIMQGKDYCDWIATGTLFAFLFLAQQSDLSEVEQEDDQELD